jgi:hypothetical protein
MEGTRVFCDFKKGLLELKRMPEHQSKELIPSGGKGGSFSSCGGLNFSRFEARSRRDRFAEEGRSM